VIDWLNGGARSDVDVQFRNSRVVSLDKSLGVNADNLSR
jgi:hypothetical protein